MTRASSSSEVGQVSSEFQTTTAKSDPSPPATMSFGPQWRRSTEGWLYAAFTAGLLLAFAWIAPFVVPLPPMARVPILIMCGLALSLPGMLVSQRYHPAEAAALGAAVLSAFATIVLALAVTRQARDAAEEARRSTDVIEKMQTVQQLQYQTFIHVGVDPGINDGSYVITTRNFGGGTARDVNVSGRVGGRTYTSTYTLLGPGEEMTQHEMVPAAGENTVTLTVQYLDGLGERQSATFTQPLRQDGPPQSRYAQWRDSARQDQRRHQDQLATLNTLTQAIKDMSRELKRLEPPPPPPPPAPATPSVPTPGPEREDLGQ